MLALLARFARLLVAVAGGWLVLDGLHADLPWLFAAVVLAFVLFGTLQTLALKPRHPRQDRATSTPP